ncbi:hypothetical protein SD70_10205 [Gordoniibacillus kamchatkensis]|uniref:Uncharacterized protein n=1 Tax=Gordoniibacillus kamchatkensis TaxID=1590651 RepID=A0ABR5AIZ2_9BACL|nr:hypothetical protein [Paenibacillus sp. VKM B-2647]KIL40984.1 hypothetical protein SD70_10205 [Paenibacillus sp. VKM B-2647]
MIHPLPSPLLADLQRLLQADGMYALLTDRCGISQPFGGNSVLDFIVQEERLWPLSTRQWLKKIEQSSRPVTLELELPGLFVHVAPIKTKEDVYCLWAMDGLSAEAKSRLLDFAAAHYGPAHEWHAVLQARRQRARTIGTKSGTSSSCSSGLRRMRPVPAWPERRRIRRRPMRCSKPRHG